MWSDSSVFYQIYPLGFCDAPKENDGITSHRIRKVLDWTDYFSELGIGAILFNPILDSDRHGYDTRDFKQLDCRLGTNADFKDVCDALHDKGIRVVLDAVFNHVGRGFPAFKDVLVHREQSAYKDWFFIQFGQNNNYNDGLYYEGWEGHYEMVKLNLKNPEVVNHLLDCVKYWIQEFDLDGLRLDVAYSLDHEFMKQLRSFSGLLKPDFLLMGETLFGDYSLLTNDNMLHSCTNYECYKSIFSSFNDMNLFEISYSLNRQFGPENHAIYKGLHLFTFVDNHDVSRIASILNNKNHLPLTYGMLFSIPGIPCIYYGSEWGVIGNKQPGSDDNLRPAFVAPEPNELTEYVKQLIQLRKQSKALNYGGYKNIVVTNQQLIFERSFEDETILVAVNAAEDAISLTLNIGTYNAIDLLSGKTIQLESQCNLPPYSFSVWKLA